MYEVKLITARTSHHVEALLAQNSLELADATDKERAQYCERMKLIFRALFERFNSFTS